MLPIISQLEIQNETLTFQPTVTDFGITYLYDFTEKDFVLLDGKLIPLAGLESMKQWINNVMHTVLYEAKLYENTNASDNGLAIRDLLVGHVYPLEFIKSEIQREVTSSLLNHPAISELEEFTVLQVEDALDISFKVTLKDNYIASDNSADFIFAAAKVMYNLNAENGIEILLTL